MPVLNNIITHLRQRADTEDLEVSLVVDFSWSMTIDFDSRFPRDLPKVFESVKNSVLPSLQDITIDRKVGMVATWPTTSTLS